MALAAVRHSANIVSTIRTYPPQSPACLRQYVPEQPLSQAETDFPVQL